MKHKSPFCISISLVAIMALALVATAEADELTLDLVATTLWSGVNDIAVEGDYAYLALNYGLVVVDISDPANPVETARLFLEGKNNGLDASGNIVCVATQSHGIRVIDVSDPYAPYQVGQWGEGNRYMDATMVGDYVHPLTGWLGALVLDITDPANPTLASSNSGVYGCRSMRVFGDYAYASIFSRGFKIIDVSTPGAEVTLSSFWGEMSTNLFGVAAAGGYGYAAAYWGGIFVFDVSDPDSLVFLGGCGSPGTATDVQALGDYVYVADNSAGLTIIDVSDPEAPYVVDSYKPDEYYAPSKLELVGTTLFTNGDYHRLELLDLSNPTSPSPIGRLDFSGPPRALSVRGDRLWVGDGEGTLRSIDISDPLNPVPDPTGYPSTSGAHFEDTVVGDYLYAATWEGVMIYSLADPTAPPWQGLAGQYIHSLDVQDDLLVAYTGEFNSSNGALHFFDISDPTAPVYLSQSSWLMGYGGVDLAGDYAYAGGYMHGIAGDSGPLVIFDISDPSNPTQVAELETPSPVRDVKVVDNIAYIADLYNGVATVDVTDPTAPVFLGVNDDNSYYPLYADRITIDGPVAYLTCEYGGMTIADVSVPDHPTVVYSYGMPGWPTHTLVHDGYVYVTDTCGVRVLRVDVPAGACCLPDGSCTIAEWDECSGTLEGTYHGLESVCLGDLDENGIDDICQPTGACCLPGGSCLEASRPTCEIAAGGSYLGDGTECLGDNNDDGYDDGCEPVGACCLPDESCIIVTETDCEDTYAGSYYGDDSECLGDSNADGYDDRCVRVSCCIGKVGDANNSGDDMPSIGDISTMIDAKFISGNCSVLIVCPDEADINESGTGERTCDDITIGDISLLIDYLFITGVANMSLPDCPD